MRLRGTCLVLPGACRSVVSVCAGFGGGVVPGGTGAGGGAIAYDQSGIWAVVAARTGTVRARGNAARMTSPANLRIKSLHSRRVIDGATIRPNPGFGIRDSGSAIRDSRFGPYTRAERKNHENRRVLGALRACRQSGGRADHPGRAKELQHRSVAPERAQT